MSLNRTTIITSTWLIVATVVMAARVPISKRFNETECENAYDECDFTFSGWDVARTYSMALLPDQVFTGIIVNRHTYEYMGVAHSRHPVQVLTFGGQVKNISSYGSPPFQSNHFRASLLDEYPFSGVSHVGFKGSQYRDAQGLCLRIYFNTYQLLTDFLNPRVVKNENQEGNTTNCLVFKTQIIG
eukprot:GO256209.1.p1 GENE.GO256209.1~~GO256209.1.p1  ORF type:complete len:185 (+),score=12.58 GO256209.1:64-618(+)